ncbi:MAG: FAD/NAD(P)-binding protein [Verrucomicrobia bacterium]|nr:FAD/NAD(P)-binding protein [Verrucomicrobiota bacterium]
MASGSPDASAVDVAIIGAGFCGSMVAVNLLRKAKEHVDVALIERSGSFARGLAYGTTDRSHLLNVPAAKMGAFPDDHEHFYRWACENPEELKRQGVNAVEPHSFLPRVVYGKYLVSLLDQVNGARGSLRRIAGEAIDVAPQANGRFRVKLRNAPSLIAQHVVLALGNFPPGDPKLRDQRFHRVDRYLENPWSEETRMKLAEPGDVLILGSGLTGLDLLLSLAPLKSQGTVHVLSRRGLFPRPHRVVKPFPPFLDPESLPRTARQACRLVRVQVEQAGPRGIDWRAVIDSIRPYSQQIWKQWSTEERRRFLRHLKAFWEPHRHRAAPEVLELKSQLEKAGRLHCHKGRIFSISPEKDVLSVEFRDSNAHKDRVLRVNYVVNCTGPECNYHKLTDPLVVQLFSRGIIVPDPLFLGLDVGLGGTILNLQGERVTHLHTLGSPQKGILFETTAVPELRGQAAELAGRILYQLEHRRNSHALDQSENTAMAFQI